MEAEKANTQREEALREIEKLKLQIYQDNKEDRQKRYIHHVIATEIDGKIRQTIWSKYRQWNSALRTTSTTAVSFRTYNSTNSRHFCSLTTKGLKAFFQRKNPIRHNISLIRLRIPKTSTQPRQAHLQNAFCPSKIIMTK